MGVTPTRTKAEGDKRGNSRSVALGKANMLAAALGMLVLGGAYWIGFPVRGPCPGAVVRGPRNIGGHGDWSARQGGLEYGLLRNPFRRDLRPHLLQCLNHWLFWALIGAAILVGSFENVPGLVAIVFGLPLPDVFPYRPLLIRHWVSEPPRWPCSRSCHAAIGLTETTSDAADSASAETLSAAGAIALIVVLAIAYYCGGYVGGRMSRFDGARQGIGVWAIGLLITLAAAVLAVVAGSEYNVVERANLPRLPIGEETLTTGGAIAASRSCSARCCLPPSAASPARATTTRWTARATPSDDWSGY